MILEEEVRDGYTVTTTMKNVWAIELEMAQKVIDVCHRHKLQVWAWRGTMLGCVRHKGFIPWDDDLDLAMPREDYEKLLSLGESEFKSPYFLQSAYSEKSPYPRPHAQVRKDGTTAVVRYESYMRFHQGIFIDIFPIDDAPDTDEEFLDFVDQVNQGCTRLDYWRRGFLYTMRPCMIVNRLKAAIYRLSHNFKDEYRQFDALMTRYVGSGGNRVCRMRYYKTHQTALKKIFDRSLFSRTIMMPFEDSELPVPAEYDKLLTIYYGDYMTPVKGASIHGPLAALDPYRPYTEYLPLLQQQERSVFWHKILRKFRLWKGSLGVYEV